MFVNQFEGLVQPLEVELAALRLQNGPREPSHECTLSPTSIIDSTPFFHCFRSQYSESNSLAPF
jgi:hypothetical protein